MKPIKSVLLLLVVCALAFNSCKKNNTPKVAPQSISLIFDGVTFSSAAPVASYSKSQNALQVTANLGGSTSIYLTIPSNVKVGTFDIATNESAATFIFLDLLSPFFATSGNVVITSFTSTTVAGVFQFSGENQYNLNATITSGQFQANYTAAP